jgi:phage repressor protein C with HTH and peptisase S24 domain
MDENDASVRLCENANTMGTPDEEPLLYRKLMAAKPVGMTPNRWLTEAGVNRSFFTTLKKRGNANWQTVEKLLTIAGLTPDEFAAMQSPATDRDSVEEERALQKLPFLRDDEERRDIPMLGTALGADFEVSDDGVPQFAEVTDLHLDEVVDHLRRPVSLKNRPHLYALSVVGASMSPRYEPGDPTYIDPKATPRIGDDVVVYLRKPEGEEGERVFSVLLKRLVKRTAAFIELEQFNPPVTFKLEAKSVARIDRVIPWREIAIF